MTAFQGQVMQKNYKGSSEFWRRYEPYLDQIFDPLEETYQKAAYICYWFELLLVCFQLNA